MVDTQKLLKAIDTFKFNSKPSSGNSADLVTIKDVNNLIRETAIVLTKFVTELEQED